MNESSSACTSRRGEHGVLRRRAGPTEEGTAKELLNYAEFLDEIEKTFLRRNVAEFEWADDIGTETNEPPPDDEA